MDVVAIPLREDESTPLSPVSLVTQPLKRKILDIIGSLLEFLELAVRKLLKKLAGLARSTIKNNLHMFVSVTETIISK